MASALPSPTIYEISTRPWLYSLSQKYGKSIKLRDVPTAEWKAIAAMNMDVVWLMGIWSLGEFGLNHDRTTPSLLEGYSKVLPGYTQADIIGSPYAITNYTINPEIGTEDDLVAVRKLLHSLGMKVRS